MRNPLSYINEGQVFTGKEINEWCYAQLDKGTSFRAREARRLLRKHYKDNRLYVNAWTCRDSGSGSPSMMIFRRYENENEIE